MEKHTQPTIEFVMIADRAEVLGGKLYVMGGCWDRVSVPQVRPDAALSMGVALRILLPSEAVPRQHRIGLRVDGPGNPSVVPDQLGFMLQPQTSDESPQLSVLVATECFVAADSPGLHEIVASVDGQELARSAFRIVETEPRIAG